MSWRDDNLFSLSSEWLSKKTTKMSHGPLRSTLKIWEKICVCRVSALFCSEDGLSQIQVVELEYSHKLEFYSQTWCCRLLAMKHRIKTDKTEQRINSLHRHRSHDETEKSFQRIICHRQNSTTSIGHESRVMPTPLPSHTNPIRYYVVGRWRPQFLSRTLNDMQIYTKTLTNENNKIIAAACRIKHSDSHTFAVVRLSANSHHYFKRFHILWLNFNSLLRQLFASTSQDSRWWRWLWLLFIINEHKWQRRNEWRKFQMLRRYGRLYENWEIKFFFCETFIAVNICEKQ